MDVAYYDDTPKCARVVGERQIVCSKAYIENEKPKRVETKL